MTIDEDIVKQTARKYALENAVAHGKAVAGAVMGKVMSERADLRAHAKLVQPLIAEVVDAVNAMDPAARDAAFKDVEGAVGAARQEKEERTGPLKALKNAEHGKVVLRLAPNPSGPPHFGHGRGMVILDTYRRMYDGQLVLRMDDTDTTVKPPWPPAYDMFPETLTWLCGKPADKVIRASAHMERYYEVAEDLLTRGGAYVCSCEGDVFRELKNKGEPCPHRGLEPEENLERWRKMLDGGYARGEAVLRVKTDITHKDPALRDWVGVRIAEEPHPLVGAKYRAWPVLDFQSAIDDHDEGVTHIVRGKDLRDSTAKQAFLYEHLEWAYPETTYWGRVSVHEFGKFSKSVMQEAIARGEYSGWDDPRLPTFPALRRRGFQPAAIQAFWLSFGISEKDIAASIKTLEAENRKIVEPHANRYFFVPDPAPFAVRGASADLAADAPLHPDHPERGDRHLVVDEQDGENRVLVARDDLAGLALGEAGKAVRLKDLANVTTTGDGGGAYEGTDLAFLKERKAPIIQWVPADPARHVDAVLVTDDARDVHGKAERALLNEAEGAIVQLERVGFARVDAVDAATARVALVFTHK